MWQQGKSQASHVVDGTWAAQYMPPGLWPVLCGALSCPAVGQPCTREQREALRAGIVFKRKKDSLDPETGHLWKSLIETGRDEKNSFLEV